MKNVRRGPDFMMKMINRISVISWIVLAIVISILIFNNPALRGMTLVKMPSREISTGWLALIYAMFIFLIIINIAGIFFNTQRLKRKTDTIRLTFFFSIIFAVLGLIIGIR